MIFNIEDRYYLPTTKPHAGLKQSMFGGIPYGISTRPKEVHIWREKLSLQIKDGQKLICVLDPNWESSIIHLGGIATETGIRSVRLYAEMVKLLSQTERLGHSTYDEIIEYINKKESYIYQIGNDAMALIMILPGQPRVVSYVDSPIGESCLRKLNQYLVAYNL
jgi:hypothetical protein